MSYIQRRAVRTLITGLALISLALGAVVFNEAGVHRAVNDTAMAGPAAKGAVTKAATKTDHPVVDLGNVQHIASWTWYGYKLNWWETNQIANVSLWSASWGVSSTRLLPYSGWITRAYAWGWILAARNARSMGQCLAISYVYVGLIVGC